MVHHAGGCRPSLVVPANQASWEDLQAVFGAGGEARTCQCQWFKIGNAQWRSVSVTERAGRLREQTACGHPEASTTSGFVADLDGEPAGWCAVHRARPTCACCAPAFRGPSVRSQTVRTSATSMLDPEGNEFCIA